MIFKLVILLSIVGMSFSAMSRQNLPPKPSELADKEGCYVEEINDVIPFGSTVTPIGYCYSISCGTKLLTYASCGAISVKGLILTKMDLTKPYPACCPRPSEAFRK